jgi:hypothetical protein
VRKFGEEPPEEWIAALTRVNDYQVERGLRRMVFGWKGGPPSLPDFVRYCRAIGDEYDEGPRDRAPAPKVEGPKLDGWDISGNIRFWKYITHRLADSYRPWGAASTEEHDRCTGIAMAYKNAWAADMRESDQLDPSSGEIIRLPEEEQSRLFADCMRRAEADIAGYRATRRAA